MSTPTWENQMRLEVNRDAEPPDRDRDRGGGGGEDGGEQRGLEDREEETGLRSKTTNRMREATPARHLANTKRPLPCCVRRSVL